MIFRQSAGRVSALVALALSLVALLVVFVLPPDMFFGARNTDTVSEFIASRAFLADSLRGGHLPLWNPYTYGGQPFLGGFESGVLYPLNILFVFLPLSRALNFSFLLHLILLGWGMERWASRRGLHPAAAALAGAVVPLSGAVFPHIYAGHISNLCTMAWAPWIFLGFEMWMREGARRGLFLASAAICLQILAGHVQYVFYTAVAVGIEAVLLSIVESRTRRSALPAVIGCYLTAAALGAVLLLPGFAALSEGVRQEGVDYSFAAMFGFPPENFVTIIAPGFFGSLDQPVYWGRCYLWEMSLFVGAAGPVLMAVALCDSERRRQAWLDLAMAGLLLVLAMGVHTPLFFPLYQFAPGFGHFRAWAKFVFPATLFLALLIAGGADALLRGKRPARQVILGAWIAGVLVSGAGLFYLASPENISGLFAVVVSSRESYLPVDVFRRADFIHQAGIHAGLSLGLAGLVLIATGGIFLGMTRWPVLRWGVPLILCLEMIGFAAGQVTMAPLSDAAPPELKQFASEHPGDYRVLNLNLPNNGFLLGRGDLWGNNPSVLRRYAEFMTYSQGDDPDHASQYLNIKGINSLYAMLRFRYAFLPAADGSYHVNESSTPPLPRVLVISDWKKLTDRNELFSAMHEPSFDPAKTVLLESNPSPQPEAGTAGSAKVISEEPDALTIEADTDKPALLLITDLYARDWHAEALTDSVQKSYDLLPADYILRAVPLEAGHHHLRVVYAPASFPIGLGISAVAWAIWLGLFLRMKRRSKRAG